MTAAQHYDDMNLVNVRSPSYEHSIHESRSSFSSVSDSGSSVQSDGRRAQPPEKIVETRERISTHTLLETSVLPVLNILATLSLIVGIVFVYARADGKPVNFTMASIPVPSLLALLVSLAVLFIGGGIGYAVSEYKWARFQRTASQLALLDAYDACSRGVGGAIRAIPSLRLDAVLLATIIFYLGILAIGPAAQGIISARTYDICSNATEESLLMVNISQPFFEINASTKDPRTITGVRDFYSVQLGLRQYFQQLPVQIADSCSVDAINCSYNGIGIPYIGFECTQTPLDNIRIIDVHSNNITTVEDYIDILNEDFLSLSAPGFFYEASMAGRTHYDLRNISLPYNYSSSSEAEPFDQGARDSVGDVTMVVVSHENTMSYQGLDSDTLEARRCTLRPYYNWTEIYNVRGNIGFNILSSEPVTMDYDNIIGNNVYLNEVEDSDVNATIQLNMYALQLSVMRALVLGEGGIVHPVYNRDTVEQNLRNFSNYLGLTYVLTSPGGSDELITTTGPYKTTCKETELLFALNPASYYPLALCLLVPLAWWTVTWIVSLYQVNGVSRGHSQVALLVSGLTPVVREKMRGTIHENQYAVMTAAGKVKVKFGERASDGQPTFGLPQEVKPIGVRRMSF